MVEGFFFHQSFVCSGVLEVGEAVSDILVVDYCTRSQAFIGVGKQEVRVSDDRLEDSCLEREKVWGGVFSFEQAG